MAPLVPVARIYSLQSSAMQSGRGGGKRWVLERQQVGPFHHDPLTGWSGSGLPNGRHHLEFESLESALAYANSVGLSVEVSHAPRTAHPAPKVYADNFRTDRRGNWTH